MITATLLLQYVWAMTGMALLRRDTRGDPAAWLLAGGLVSGLSAMLLIDHPSAGQLYFARTALPLGAVLAGWGLAAAVRAAAGPVDPAGAAARWRIVALLAVGASAGIGAVLLGARWGSGPSSAADIPAALSAPLLVLGVALAVGCAGWLVLARISRFGLAGGGSAVLAAAVLAGCLTYGPHNSLRSVRAALTGPTRPLGPHAVSAGETEAALWLRQHAGEEDVVATNVHCIDFRTRPYCDSRAFWVSALSERLVLVEGWGYTDEAQAAHGRNGRSYHNQPFDDPALLALNDGAFTDPTPAALARLRDRHGVRWLFADRRAGPVSPLLARYAQLRHTSGDGSVFQLRPAG
jgi:hypothetical protein